MLFFQIKLLTGMIRDVIMMYPDPIALVYIRTIMGFIRSNVNI